MKRILLLGLFVFNLCQSSCFIKNNSFRSDFKEYDNVCHIAKILRVALRYPPPRDMEHVFVNNDEWKHTGAKQQLIIDLDCLKRELKRSNCRLVQLTPMIKIKYKWNIYRIELRWIGKNTVIKEEAHHLIIDFENAYIPNEPKYIETPRVYPFTIYNNRDQAYVCYFYTPKDPCYPMVAPYFGLTFKEDQERLKRYDFQY